MGQNITRRRFNTMVTAPLVALAGCAATGRGSDGSEALLKRVKAYWLALESNDHITAWSFEEVSKDPTWTLQSYLQVGGVGYEAAKVRDVRSIEGDRALVDVWTKYSLPMLRLKGQETVVQDEWRRIDGQWYHVLNKGSLFKTKK